MHSIVEKPSPRAEVIRSLTAAVDVPWSQPSAAAAGKKRYAPSKLAVLMDVAKELGLPAAAVLAGTGLDAAALQDPFTLTSPSQFLHAASNVVRMPRGHEAGIRIGARLHATCYGMYGYALLCSESMRHVFDFGVRFHQLANGMLQVKWFEQEGLATWLLPSYDAILLRGVDETLYRFLVDLQFGVHVTLFKDAMGTWCVPAHACFACEEPVHAALLAELLECPLSFGQPENTLSYPAAWLSRAPQLANPITAAHVSSQCVRLLEEFKWDAGLTRRVYQELTRTPGQFPDIEVVAETLGMTSRTLRRKLVSEGTSFTDLLANIRKALAIDYLSTTRLTIDDIAAAIGFSDAVSFRHAFKRWTGKSPGAYR
jgi:AraC-like DNA-binding protein